MTAAQTARRPAARGWRRSSLTLLGAVLAGLVAGGAAFAMPDAGEHATALDDPVIVIENFTFQGTLTVPAGATIVVRNADAAPHTVTAIDGSFNTDTIAGGASTTFVAPDTPGSYPFRCTIHPTMTATLVVTQDPGPSPDPTTTSSPAPSDTPTAPPPPADPVIVIRDFAFLIPLTVAPAAVITVRNDDSAPHTLTADDGGFDTGVISPGGTATITAPAEPGSYPLHCAIHPFMTGALTVATGTPTPPPPTGTVTPPPTETLTPPPTAAAAAHHRTGAHER
jgi:plastocyanin